MPPAEFCCDFDFTGKALENHQLALERLLALFDAPENGAAVNTWSHNWLFDGASLELTTFIREKTRGYNPLYQRHPGAVGEMLFPNSDRSSHTSYGGRIQLLNLFTINGPPGILTAAQGGSVAGSVPVSLRWLRPFSGLATRKLIDESIGLLA